MKEKIILATVNAKKNIYAVTADEFSAIAPNVHLGLLSEYARSKGIDVVMVESDVEGISFDELIDIVTKEGPLLLGIICSGLNPSSSTMVMAGVIDFFKRYHERGVKVKTFVWGLHPTTLPEQTLRETGADYVIRAEGYQTIVELTHLLSGRGQMTQEGVPGLSFLKDPKDVASAYLQTADAPLLDDLNLLPPLDWERMNPARYRAHNWHTFGDLGRRSPYAVVWTSFGCPFKCNFCSINNLFGKRGQRFRSIDNVIKEIDVLVMRYGVRHIKILDELFVASPSRVEEFCDRLDERGYNLNMWAYSRVDTINRKLLRRLKKVGMNWIAYGFESATDSVLKSMNKGSNMSCVDDVIRMTQDEGIYICAGIMFGLWEEDVASMQRSYDFLVKYNFEWANMYPVFGLPGTALYEKMPQGISWKSYALYGYDCCPMPTKHLSSAQVLRFRDEAFNHYHSRPEYLSMIEKCFGAETRTHIERMVALPLKRRLLE